MSPMTNRNMLLTTITEGSKEIDILGYMAWWSLRKVSITREKLQELLEQAGLNKNYAVEHNYLSAFKRALKSLEEKRIIRIVSDNAFIMRCQFTAEKIEDSADGSVLSYDRETIIEINKEIYRKEKDFAKAVTQGKEEIIIKLVDLFNWEKIRYNSHDINRYIQNILKKEADIISLRDQGCLYFVPAGFQTILDSVRTLVENVAKGAFITMPVPNLASSKTLVKTAIKGDVENALSVIETEMEQAAKSDQTITEIWTKTRITRIKKLRQRLANYSDLLDGAEGMQKSAERLEKEIMRYRTLKID